MLGIGNNISSLKISNDLQTTSKALSRSLERLSTGKRINSAKDDAAGLSSVVELESQIRGLKQANLNISSTLGLLQTADSAISVQVDILQRMRELAIQGASGGLTATDRTSLTSQLQSLRDEFSRITNETEFNGTKLLNGTFGSKDIQIGSDSGDDLSISLSSLTASSVFSETVGSGSFSSVDDITVGDGPNDFTLADFDGDGNLDIATAEVGTTDQISIRLGNGDGSFGSAITTASQGASVKIEAADLNKDGILDLVVLDNNSTESVEIHIGNGDGSFQAFQSVAVTETLSESVTIADFNGDGYNDIAVGTNTTSVEILFNEGDGSFDSVTTISTGTGVDVLDLVSGDFDGDGDQDFMAGDNDGGSQVFINDGSGTFTGLTTFDSTTGTSAVPITGDFNDDGILDLIVGAGSSTTVSLLEGNGDGTFASGVDSTTGAAVTALRSADVDNDGDLDLVGTNAIYSVLLNDGSGSFTETSSDSLDSSSSDLRLGDINSDGAVDILNSVSADDAVMVQQAATTTQAAVSKINVDDVDSATQLIGIIDTALDGLLEERTSIANNLTRLESVLDSNSLLSENYASAKSSIEDTDIALETSELVRQQVLQQAQIAALSQANVNAQVVLGVLQF